MKIFIFNIESCVTRYLSHEYHHFQSKFFKANFSGTFVLIWYNDKYESSKTLTEIDIIFNNLGMFTHCTKV